MKPISGRDPIVLELIKALGLEMQGMKALSLSFKANEYAEVTAIYNFHDEQAKAFIDVVKKYNLIAVEDKKPK